MSGPRLVRFESVGELRANAARWDDLWRRCEGVLPTGQAELVADWMEQFVPRAKFVALGVEQDGQLVAALPLVDRRIAKVVRAGSLPWNFWCWAGHLMVDMRADVGAVLELMVAEFSKLPWPLLWFDTVPLNSAIFKRFVEALDAAGLGHEQQERFRFGRVEITEQLGHDWEAYEKAWSGNHRRHMRKARRRAEEEGGVKLEMRRPTEGAEVEMLLREGFEVEHRSWKGEEGTSVLVSPAAWEFYLRQATQLAKRGQLELAFLRYEGKAIGFEYGWSSGGVYYTPKVGFDGAYSRFSPGQVLRYLLLKEFFAQPERNAVDFLGPLSEATAKWSTMTYPVCRLVVDSGRRGGGTLLWAYRNLGGAVRRMKGGKGREEELKLVELAPRREAVLPAVTAEV